MQGWLEVLDGGIGNSIQDRGRFGFRHMGIAVSGWMNLWLARCANALVGNPRDAACIEIRAAGPRLCVLIGPVRVALAGNVNAEVRRGEGETQTLQAWQSITLNARDELAIGFSSGGAAYLAVSGGIETPEQLASRSTYQRAQIGGIDGKNLCMDQRLPCQTVSDPGSEYHAPPWRYAEGPIRLLPGPQDQHFRAEALVTLFSAEYRVTPQLDRMGIRLEGPPLEHIAPEAKDIVSDGVTPGCIQVPGNGQPIILLADCQTVGGYPKIATVISADLPRLGLAAPGQTLRFQCVTMSEARAALLARENDWKEWLEQCVCELANSSSGNEAESVW